MRPGPACSNVTGPALAGETTVTPSELACGGCRSAIGRCLCSFEAVLRRYELDDPVLWAIARIVHEADLEDERYDAPEARGLDVLLRGLSMVRADHEVLELSGPLYDGLYEYLKRGSMLGREPA